MICCTIVSSVSYGQHNGWICIEVPYEKKTCTNRAPCLGLGIYPTLIYSTTVISPWRPTTHFRYQSYAYLLLAMHVVVPTSHFRAHPQSSQHNPSDKGDKRDCRGIPTPECTPNGTHAGMAVHTAQLSDAPLRCPAHHCRLHHSHHPDIRRTPSHCRPPALAQGAPWPAACAPCSPSSARTTPVVPAGAQVALATLAAPVAPAGWTARVVRYPPKAALPNTLTGRIPEKRWTRLGTMQKGVVQTWPLMTRHCGSSMAARRPLQTQVGRRRPARHHCAAIPRWNKA